MDGVRFFHGLVTKTQLNLSPVMVLGCTGWGAA